MLNEGKEIRDFTLKKFLGRGGFGEVWLAEKKIEIADKKVAFALKFINAGADDLKQAGSVKSEINTWIDASGNKNVLSVLDGFTYENYFVIVSEYADKGSLREWLRNNGGKSPSLEKTVEIMGGILNGLTHLHTQKIVHRDLKPENVLLKGDVPCIADFGVSKIVETVSLTNSQSGTNSAGSPLYMSPESFERIKPAPQIDIWSAGVILFEMLSGKTPYAADTIPALIFEIVTKEPRQLPNDVPASIKNVVMKSLAKDVSERYVSAKEMHDALMRALYLKDYSENVLETETVPADKLKNAATARETISSAATIPIKNYTVAQQAQPKGKSKGLAFAGIGLAALVAVSAIVYGIKQYEGGANSANPQTANQKTAENVSTGGVNTGIGQTAAETNTKNNSNSQNSDLINTVNREVAEKTRDTNAVKSDNQNKTVIQPQKSVRTEPKLKRETAEKKSKTKKDVTLDDIMDKKN